MHKTTIGAEISKDHIDLHRLPGDQRLRVTNDRKGFAAILGWIGDEPVERIVYEPTGAYHRAFECFMLTRGLPVSKVNPRRRDCLKRRMRRGCFLGTRPGSRCCLSCYWRR